MAVQLKTIHRFVVSQSIYPLVLSTLLAFGILAGRIFIARTWNHTNLVWNLFLAWIPYVCSLAAYAIYQLNSKHWPLLVPITAVWLLFFPNAPYIITDFLHLQERPPIPLWYDIGLIATFAWTGFFLGIVSLRTMQFIVKKYLGGIMSWLFALSALLLSGLGIYLGRFGRFNSWDMFFSPITVLRDILERFSSAYSILHLIAFTAIFTGVLFVTYLMFVSIRSLEMKKDQRLAAEDAGSIHKITD